MFRSGREGWRQGELELTSVKSEPTVCCGLEEIARSYFAVLVSVSWREGLTVSLFKES